MDVGGISPDDRIRAILDIEVEDQIGTGDVGAAVTAIVGNHVEAVGRDRAREREARADPAPGAIHAFEEEPRQRGARRTPELA